MTTLIIILAVIAITIFLNRHFIIALITVNRKAAISSTEFKRIVNTHFRNRVAEFGFIGKDWIYKKEKAGFKYSIEFLMSKYGGEFAIEMSVHPGRTEKYKDLENNQPSFWKRLTPSNQGDHWWRFKKKESDNIKLLNKVLLLLSSKGMAWFDKYQNFPGQFAHITVEDLENNKKLSKKLDIDYKDKFHWALGMINVNEELNHKDKVKEFAEFGLKQIQGMGGISWKPYFEEKQNRT